MNAANRVVSQLNARRVREGVFKARCPAHLGKSNTSLSITDAGDRVLIHCHAGCPLPSILQALGIKSVAELFDSATLPPDPELQRQARILRGLEIWCERRLIHVCKQLRDVDTGISLAAGSLTRYEDGAVPRDPKSENQLWNSLVNAYRMRTEYEEEFDILNQPNLQPKYELFRRRQ